MPERSVVFMVPASRGWQCFSAQRYVVAAASDSRHWPLRSRRPSSVVPGAVQFMDAVHVSHRIIDIVTLLVVGIA